MNLAGFFILAVLVVAALLEFFPPDDGPDIDDAAGT